MVVCVPSQMTGVECPGPSRPGQCRWRRQGGADLPTPIWWPRRHP